MHLLVPMTHAPRHRRLLAALVALALGVPTLGGVAAAQELAPPPEVGSDGVPPPDSIPEPLADLGEEGPPPQAFPDVPGVDLRSLGYDGLPLDSAVIDRATADLPGDPRERVAEIAGRLDELPPQVEGLVAAERVLAEAVRRLDERTAAARGATAVATLVAQDAADRSASASAQVRDRTDELEDHRRRMAEVAVAAYVRPPDADSMSSVLGGAAVSNDDLTADVLLDVKADHDAVVRDDLEVSRAVAVERLEVARRDEARAVARADTARGALARAERRRDLHREALAQVAAARVELEAALPALRADMDRTIEETWGALDALAAGPGVDGSAIVVVDGIRIHAAIAPKLQALLAAARADGVPLGGWGHRSTAQQVELRRKHCGPTPEDIWLKPSSQCSPPTARPGASMHERGLAVDFHLGGRAISTRESPGYQWLAENAAAFGFFNLPSEPWHWSVNGR